MALIDLDTIGSTLDTRGLVIADAQVRAQVLTGVQKVLHIQGGDCNVVRDAAGDVLDEFRGREAWLELMLGKPDRVILKLSTAIRSRLGDSATRMNRVSNRRTGTANALPAHPITDDAQWTEYKQPGRQTVIVY